MEDAYAGWNTYICIERQGVVAQDDYFWSGCPARVPTQDALGNVIALNGIIFVESTLAVPHSSFVALIAAYPTLTAWVQNVDTGELRYYDGTQVDDTEFWTPMQRAIGKCKDFKITNKRTLERDKELGQISPASIKAHQYDVDITINKVFIDKRKKDPAAPDRTSPVWNQFGFGGPGVVERDTRLKLVQPDKQDYYMVILYTYDASSDVLNVARVTTSPCAMFESYEVTDETEKILMVRLVAQTTYTYNMPSDYGNIVTYAQSSP